MKILYILHSSEDNGSEKAFYNIVSFLRNYDVEILVALPGKGILYNKLRELKIKTYSFPIQMSIYPPVKRFKDIVLFIPRLILMLLYNLSAFINLKKIIKAERPDILHSNVGVIHLGHYVGKIYNIPHVWHIREFQDIGLGYKPFPGKSFFLKCLQDSNNYLIAITEAVYEHYQMDKARAKVIYDGVFSNKTIPVIKKEKKNYFLYVGRIEKAKGVEEILGAFAELLHLNPESELWLAGSVRKDYQEKILHIIKEDRIFSKIRFLGFRTDVADLMSEAMAIIVATPFEGFGFITAEAMYNGCLVVGNNAAGTKEQFDIGLKKTGKEIGIRYSGHKELVKNVIDICEKGITDYIPMLERAQKVVLESYSLEQNAKNIYNLYFSLINER